MLRWICLASLVLAMGISGHFRHKARRASGTIPRAREGSAIIALRLLFGLPLAAGILAWLAQPGWVEWASYDSAGWLSGLGAAMTVFAVPCVYWVFRSIGSNVSETVLTKEHHELVTHGPYRWIRHPLYTTGIVLIVGIGLAAANWFILALAVIASAAIRIAVIPKEEAMLVRAFGEDYTAYMRRTGRLVPRLRSVDTEIRYEPARADDLDEVRSPPRR